MKKLSWEPIRRGLIYCASACGSGCTLAAYKRACKRGKALAKKLGKGWKARIHENMGWHYCAHSSGGFVTVYESYRLSGKPTYSALANTTGNVGSGQWVVSSVKTPQAAVHAALVLMQKEQRAIQKALASVRGGAGQ